METTSPTAVDCQLQKAGAFVLNAEVDTGDEPYLDLASYIPKKALQNTRRDPVHSCVNEIYEAQFQARPDAPAVCACDGSLTYRELNNCSAVLANKLRRQGVKAEGLVALLFEKSKLMAVAMHAVIKAGGAFMMWDPSFPVARLRGMFGESGAHLVLASAGNSQMASEISDNVIVVDEIHPLDTAPLDPGNRPENALYSVYTSGSTGKPKGFLIEHKAVCTCALALGSEMGITENSRFLQFSSNSFDLAAFEHLLPFLFGACLCIPSESERKSDLNRALDSYGITHAILTPSVSRLIDPKQLTALRTLLLGGEASTQEDVRRWTPYVQLLNGYSPAEAGCLNVVNPGATQASPNNIGFPLTITPWVVDPENHNRLMRAGDVGELVIQGHTLARGYFGPPERSAAAFIDTPTWARKLACESYGRMYKTGDLVRFDVEDGSLHYVGRKDLQVKVRGQRLELAEVEFALQQCFPSPHSVLAEVIVTDGREPSLLGFVCRQGQRQLMPIAPQSDERGLFLVPDSKFCAEAQVALTAMGNTLPSYMVPSDLLLISHLPMLPSGKTDRGSLRTLAAGLNPAERRGYSSVLRQHRDEPRDELEHLLLVLWATSLSLAATQVGVKDNFFHLGGSSLDAIHLAAGIRKMGFSELSSAIVFNNPTIREMADTLKVIKASSQPQNTSPLASFELDSLLAAELLRKVGISPDDLECGFLPVTPFQRKSCLLKPMHLTIDISGIDHARLEAAWTIVQQNHISLRSIYVMQNGDIYQAFLRRPGSASIPIFRCEERVGDYAARFCDHDTRNILDGRPWWSLSRVDSHTESSLVLRTTHAQIDAMTLDAIFKDFMAVFEGQELSQRGLEFPRYMQSRLTHNTSTAATAFWSKFLDGSEITRPILLDPSLVVDPESESMVFVSREMTAMTPPAGITLAAVFRAAWAFVLSQYTKEDDVVFGEFVEGRSLPISDVDKVTGCTAAEAPMRITIPSGASVLDLLHHSQKQHVSRIPYETCELEDIIPRCTSWPIDTAFSHILILENVDVVPPVVLDGQLRKHRWAFHGRLEDVHVQLFPGHEKLQVGISGPAIRLSESIATLLVDKLEAAFRDFITRPEAPLSDIAS
ncbi:hypothetical protein ASPVEDRAFT_135907 [Aspergillus versicolor CBS 583.65]|uniref:Carrier domain-containing protein n=1 Tax=Aspergillus versicolor CBS 583.65 TaxID=1036611 RepID=A0A1L9PR50_ASPVE|nr:uncharacterized protein ASPVEDRAFT_135907 [Aspergillus versicolor CBS 583.65]OJJ03912.1 hypothetical protein ASPVEDRAFT_135907 [Aspergillus versicolor CBS 583.65]